MRTTTVRRPNGSVAVRVRRTVATGPNRDHFVWNRTRDVAPTAGRWLEELYGGSRSVRAYSNASATVVESVITDDRRSVVRYSEDGTDETPFTGAYRDFTGETFVMDTFLEVGTRVTGVDRTGETVRYRLAASAGPHRLKFDTPFPVEVRVLSLSATVERTGLVRRLVLKYALVHDNRTVVVRETLRVTDVGATTVERPAWVDEVEVDAVAGVRADRTTAVRGVAAQVWARERALPAPGVRRVRATP